MTQATCTEHAAYESGCRWCRAARRDQLAAQFTVVGAYSGKVYATQVGADRAAWWAHTNGMVGAEERCAAELETLTVGEAWKSHADARGIKITRTG